MGYWDGRMLKVIVEIRAAEGGDDAKLLVQDQFRIYQKLANKNNLKVEIIDERPGMLIFRVKGILTYKTFKDEAGGHRWQRVPPTEKGGRVHTSTITVAVLPEPTTVDIQLSPNDLEFSATTSSVNAGGQNRDKVATCVTLKYKPTGLTVRCESSRSQQRNRELATVLLKAHLWNIEQQEATDSRANDRKEQIGSGMRGDKRRTIRVKDGVVKDHITNQRWQIGKYLNGDW